MRKQKTYGKTVIYLPGNNLCRLFMKKRLYLTFIILFFAGCISAQTPLTVAKDFTAKDLDGNTHHLFDYLDNDKYVLIDFFTASCGSCQVYASEVNAAYNDFGCNTGNVIFLGINWGSSNAIVHEFDSVYGAFFPAISGTQGGGNRVVDSFQVLSYPTVVLIAPDHQILSQYIWPPSQLALDSIISAHGGIMQTCNVGAETNPRQKPASSLLVWPNPATDKVNINVRSRPGAEVSIYSSQGSLVRKLKIDDFPEGGTWQLNEITGMLPGIYLFVLKEDGTIIATSKLIVK